MSGFRAGLVLALSVLASACSKSAEPVAAALAPVAEAPAKPAEIAWRHGEVSEGLAEAAQSGKPVLLYWGAVWCPPCNQLKATVFKDPAFIATTQAFIPIYLDGDSPGAQKWGEQFGITGYPTLVVLRSDGTELTRLMGGLELTQYPRQLEIARRQTRPVAELAKSALADGKTLSSDDWTLLANYGWVLDAGRTAPPVELSALLAKLAAAAPDGAIRQRLQLAAWAQALRTDGGETTAADRPQRLALLEAVLADPAALRANLSDLSGLGPKMLAAVAKPGSPEWKRGAEALRAALTQLHADPSTTQPDRLDSWSTQIALARLEQPKGALPTDLLSQVRQAVATADAATATPYERVATVNAAAGLLNDAGLPAEAETLLRREAEHSAVGYYFMSDLADLAKERGDKAAALEWLRKTWSAAEGPATRSQWGVAYASGLIELAPKDAATIEKTVSQLIGEAAASPDAYYRRTRVRFERLGGALQTWAKAQHQTAVVKRLDAQMQTLCAQLPSADPGRAACASLLKA